MIVSEGVPMTNGEVFALIRRRRDERNAKMQPPFGMQFVGCSSISPTQLQQHRGSASKGMGASSAHTNLFFPPETLRRAEAKRVGVNGVVPTSSLHSLNNALFTSSTASHLIVLLTEVRALRYLSRNATISGLNAVQALYGPTSVHRGCHRLFNAREGCEEDQNGSIDQRDRGEDCDETNDDDDNNNNNNGNSNGRHALLINSARGRDLEALEQVLRCFRPGTIGHVRAVDAILSLWEMNGQEQERRCATRVKSVLRVLARHQGTPTVNHGDDAAMHLIKKEDEDEDDQQQQIGDRQRLPSSDQPRLLFEPPSVPLAMFLSDQSRSAAAAASVSARRDMGGVTATDMLQRQQQEKWTEEEVMRLVMARPKESLDLHRLVDNLDERLGQNEELFASLEDELLQAFV